RSQRLEAPRHDLVPWLETLDDFHLGRSHDPGLDLNELSHAIPHHENTLQLFLLPLSFLGRQRRRVLLSRRQRLSVSLLLALFQLSSRANSQGLNWDRNGVLAGRGGDFGGGRKSGTQAGRRVVQRRYHFEVLGLLGRAGRPRCASRAGGAPGGGLGDLGVVT